MNIRRILCEVWKRRTYKFFISFKSSIDGQKYQSLSFNRSPIPLIFSIGKCFVQTITIHYKFVKCVCLHFRKFYWSNLHSQTSLNFNIVIAGSGKNTFVNNNPRQQQQQRILQLYRWQCGLCENWCKKFRLLQRENVRWKMKMPWIWCASNRKLYFPFKFRLLLNWTLNNSMLLLIWVATRHWWRRCWFLSLFSSMTFTIVRVRVSFFHMVELYDESKA